MVLGDLILVAVDATVVDPEHTSLIVIIGMTVGVVHFVLQVNTAGTRPPLLLTLRL